MPKLSTAEELAIAIRSYARDAAPDTPSRAVAEQVKRAEKTLIEPFIPDWITEKLTFLVARERAAIRARRNPQRVLGYHSIRTGIVLNGNRFRDRDATLKTYRLLKKRLGAETSSTESRR